MPRRSKEETLEYQRKYRAEHQEYYKQYYLEHKEKLKDYQRKYQKDYYKLTESQRKIRKRLTAEEREQQQLLVQMAEERKENALQKLKDYGIKLEEMKTNCTIILKTAFNPGKIEDREAYEKKLNRHERIVENQLKSLINKHLIYIVSFGGRGKSLITKELYINRCDLGDLNILPDKVFEILSDFEFYEKMKNNSI